MFERLPEAIDLAKWAEYKTEIDAQNKASAEVMAKQQLMEWEDYDRRHKAAKKDYEERLEKWKTRNKAKKDAYWALPWWKRLFTQEPYEHRPTRPYEIPKPRWLSMPMWPFKAHLTEPTVEGFYDWLLAHGAQPTISKGGGEE